MADVWENIAESWDKLRQRPLKIAKEYARIWPKGKILDIGCGNCRNLLPFARAGFGCFGLDAYKKMIGLAEQYAEKNSFKVKLKQGTANKIPFSEKFDYCLLIRVLPAIQNGNERFAILSEMKHVLKNDGRALVTIWNRAYPKFWFAKHRHVPWSVGNKKYIRDYYMFWPFEIKNLLRKCGFRIMRTSRFFKQEYWVEVRA